MSGLEFQRLVEPLTSILVILIAFILYSTRFKFIRKRGKIDCVEALRRALEEDEYVEIVRLMGEKLIKHRRRFRGLERVTKGRKTSKLIDECFKVRRVSGEKFLEIYSRYEELIRVGED